MEKFAGTDLEKVLLSINMIGRAKWNSVLPWDGTLCTRCICMSAHARPLRETTGDTPHAKSKDRGAVSSMITSTDDI